MTPLKSLILSCGLTQDEAAIYLKTPLPTVKAWCGGQRNAPLKSLLRLRGLAEQVSTLAAELTTAIQKITNSRPLPPAQIILRTITTTKDAREIGLPFASTHGAILGRVLAGMAPEYLPMVSFRESGVDVEDVEII